MRNDYDPPLDVGIREIVETLAEENVETFESCGGELGHAYLEPTVRFHGDKAEGYRVFAVALNRGLRVTSLRRIYTVSGSELEGPWWEMTFKSHQGSKD
jgi:hypothetical protein